LAKRSKKGVGGSLQQQLHQAGLITGKQLQRSSKQQQRQDIQRRKGQSIDADKAVALKTRADKAEQDRQLNRQLEQSAQARSVQSQIRDLIRMNRQPREGDIAYRYVDGKKVKQMYVSETHQAQLNSGQLAIVRSADKDELVPSAVARKIMERSKESVLYLYDKNDRQEEEDDYYKDYKIPDDLTW
jgi:hypothetical protein|tara:strand:+ start:1590 stop:2147 length:558 start_codon:yes stop_codon:yes gene_type:complete